MKNHLLSAMDNPRTAKVFNVYSIKKYGFEHFEKVYYAALTTPTEEAVIM